MDTFSLILSFLFKLNSPSIMRGRMQSRKTNLQAQDFFFFFLKIICCEVFFWPRFLFWKTLFMGSTWQSHLVVIVPKKWFLVTRLLSACRFPSYFPVQYDTSGCFSRKATDCMTGGCSVKSSCFPDGPRADGWVYLEASYMEHTECKAVALVECFLPLPLREQGACSSISSVQRHISPGQPGNQSPEEASWGRDALVCGP